MLARVRSYPGVARTGEGQPAVLLALVAVYVVWGSTYLAMRVALQSFPPFIMAGVRFMVAGGALFLYLRARGAPLPHRRQWAAAALVGALLLVGGNGGVALAEQHVASGLAALGVATVPLWTVLFAGLWHRWPRRLEWAGVTVGFVGIVLLNVQGICAPTRLARSLCCWPRPVGRSARSGAAA